MKRFLMSTAILFFIFSSANVHAGFLSSLEKSRIPKISPPKVTVGNLKNGMKYFLLEDHMLPRVQMKIISRTGGIYDPENKVGLAEITGILMRSGGAGTLSPEGFDTAADNMGALLTSGINSEMGDAGLLVLSADLEKGASLLFDMIFAPSFNENRMKLAKLKIAEGIRREDDDPDSLAMKRFKQLVYGKNSPWARKPDAATLDKITVDDIKEFHKKYFRANNLILAAAGDFETKKFVDLMNRLTENAPQGEVKFPEVAEVKLEFKPGTEEIVQKKTQSFIRMGHLGIKRHNPDKYALLLLMDILGASNFKSRLMEDIRTKRGMAYSIWSDMSLGTDYGLFYVGVDTKSVQAATVIDLVKKHIERLSKEKDITSDELEFARRSLLSRLIFEFDSAFKVVDRRATFYFYGYPDNYWQIYRDKIASITTDNVMDVAHRYLHPDGLKIVMVGPKIGNKDDTK